jgi:hypothetical protein
MRLWRDQGMMGYEIVVHVVTHTHCTGASLLLVSSTSPNRPLLGSSLCVCAARVLIFCVGVGAIQCQWLSE